jgi:uncharacterized membrane protein YsdA (DUF1294 family)
MPNAPYLLPVIAAMNLIAFALMGIDKSKSKKQGARRIPEKTLFLAALFGGGLGATAGMYVFRHKTRHIKFSIGLPVLFVLHVIIMAWLTRILP